MSKVGDFDSDIDLAIIAEMSRKKRPWKREYFYFYRTTITGQKCRGWLHRQSMFYSNRTEDSIYATDKELFELRLKGETTT